MAIGGFAGLRSAEIMRLDWKHIRFDRGFIECEASMTFQNPQPQPRPLRPTTCVHGWSRSHGTVKDGLLRIAM